MFYANSILKTVLLCKVPNQGKESSIRKVKRNQWPKEGMHLNELFFSLHICSKAYFAFAYTNTTPDPQIEMIEEEE